MVSDPEGLTPAALSFRRLRHGARPGGSDTSLMPGADGRLRRSLEAGQRARAESPAARAAHMADQRLAGVPQALEGYRGAAGCLAAVLDVALVGVAFARVAPHAVADPAGLGAEHQLLVRLHQTRMLGPANLVGEGQTAAPVPGQRLAIDLGENKPRSQAGGRDVVAERCNGLDHRAVERPGNQQQM